MIVRQHGPEAAQCFGGYSWREHRDVALYVAANKVLPLQQTFFIRSGEQAVSKFGLRLLLTHHDHFVDIRQQLSGQHSLG